MKRYIALLRGINISGKNKVPMAELRKCFESLGVMEVKTCLNSGNQRLHIVMEILQIIRWGFRRMPVTLW